jgi:hypothetical protein
LASHQALMPIPSTKKQKVRILTISQLASSLGCYYNHDLIHPVLLKKPLIVILNYTIMLPINQSIKTNNDFEPNSFNRVKGLTKGKEIRKTI